MLAGVRIAFVALDPFPSAKGSGTRIRETARALADASAEVTLLTLPGREGAVPDRVALRPIRVAEGNWLARALAFRDGVARELAALRPDVVAFRGPFEGQAALAFTARGARTVFDANGLPSVELRYHYPRLADDAAFEGKLRRLEASVLAGADLVITQSETTRDFLSSRGMNGTCHVISNGADLVEPAVPSSSTAIELLYVGSFTPWQGLPELFMALRRARRSGADVSLRLIGTSKKRWQKQLDRGSRRLGIAEAVETVAPLGPRALGEAVRTADVCVAPLRRDLRNDVQGCNPIKLYEYMAAGSAVLATDLRCVREIVEHGETGWLVRASHPRALAEGIVTMAHDPALRARLAERARASIAARHTWAHRRARIAAAYAELLDRARS